MRTVSLLTLAATVTLVFGVAGGNAQSGSSSPSDRALNEKIHSYLLSNPEVVEEVLEKLQAKQDAQKAVAAKSVISSNRRALEDDPRDGIAGNVNGSITIVEFYDYRCPYCKAAAPELKQLLTKYSNVRLVLKEMPILDGEDKSHISEDAARAAIAAMAQGKYLNVHDDLLAEHHLDEQAILRILKSNGVDVDKDHSLAMSQAVSDHLADNHALAHKIGIDGTPGFVIGDQLIVGARLNDIEAAIGAQHMGS